MRAWTRLIFVTGRSPLGIFQPRCKLFRAVGAQINLGSMVIAVITFELITNVLWLIVKHISTSITHQLVYTSYYFTSLLIH
jgi:large-conductance mechanosensitive channel